MLPNFVGIGAQRAGTTWVYACLREHPQVFVPDVKEVHFFNAHFERGVHWYGNHFTPATPVKVMGELTPGYLDSDQAASRMAQVIPDARLFVVLRDPVQRAYSAYKLFRDRYGKWGFLEACQRGRDLVRVGLYAQHLERVYRSFSRDRVKVFLYEQLQSDPVGFLVELFTFLGVDPAFRPACATQRYNRVIYPRAQAWLSNLKLDWTIHAVKKTPLGTWIKRRDAAKTPHPVAAVEQFAPVREFFRDDILRLQAMTGRDLSHWLGPACALSGSDGYRLTA